jgi:hypothetical protein
MGIYSLVISQFAIENGELSSLFYPIKTVMFHSFFLCLPEGNYGYSKLHDLGYTVILTIWL